MPAVSAVRIKGLTELSRAFARADAALQKELRDALKDAAEPVREDAERLATREIRNIGRVWPRMRVGVTRRVVYVAPVARGVKSRGRASLRRPNLAPLLLEQMETALDQNSREIEERIEDMLDTVGRAWESA